MSIDTSPSNQANLTHCPYLALIDDIKTNSDFPSDFNYCHRCKQPEIPTYLHQQEVCLTQHYNECIMLRDANLKKLPQDIHFSAPAAPKAKMRPLLAAFIGLGVVAVSLFASRLLNNRFSAPYPTPPIIFTTPSPTPIAVSLVTDFTPTFNALPSVTPSPNPTKTAGVNPTATGSPTPTQILSQFCSVYDINYYSLAYLGAGKIQLVYDTQMDLPTYRMRDANGNLTSQLELPGLIVWLNESQYTDFKAFLRNPNFPSLLFLELIGGENDHISLEIIEGDNHHCSREIILPARSALFTSTRPVWNTPTRVSPTVFRSPTVTRTPTPTNTQSQLPSKTITHTSTPTRTNTYTPTLTHTYTNTPTATNTSTPEPLPSASLTPTPTR